MHWGHYESAAIPDPVAFGSGFSAVKDSGDAYWRNC
jgi:hypothetical protein